MAGTPTTAVGSVSQILKEELSFVRKETAPKVDGVFSRVYETSEGVSKGLGRDLNVKHVFASGVAGGFKNVSALGPATYSEEYTGQGQVYDPSGVRAFPSLGEQAHMGYVTRTITLVQGMGSFNIPLHMMLADAMPADIAGPVAKILPAVATMVNHVEAVGFYLPSSAQKSNLITFVDASACVVDDPDNYPASDVRVQVTVDGTNCLGRIAHLREMQLFQLFSDADAVQLSGAVLVVSEVDHLNRTFKLARVDSTPLIPANFDDNYYLALVGNATDTGPSGVETWLVESGSPFGINVARWPQFKSMIKAVGGVLEEGVLDKYIGGFYDAYGPLYELDSVIATTGILTAWRQSLDGLGRYDRNGERLRVRGGWVDMDYAWQGERFSFLASRYQHPGQVYVLKLNNGNIKRYVPPGIPGAGKKGVMPNDVQFVAPIMGSDTIFLPGMNTSAAYVEHVVAPFLMFREYAPDQMPGIKLTGCTETNHWD